MIVYHGDVKDFIDTFEDGELIETLQDRFYELMHKRPAEGEIRSWNNSISYMANVLREEINPRANVAIEFNIPNTSKRIDFMVSGKNQDGQDHVVIIELKQWSQVEVVEGKDGIVKTQLNRGICETTHPSYQALTYARMIGNFNQVVQEDKITLLPCVYMHNYRRRFEDPIDAFQYQDYIEKAPVYDKRQMRALRSMIATHTQKGDAGDVLYRIAHGKIRPSKRLQDHILSLLQGNSDFDLLDDQKIIYEQALMLANHAVSNKRKTVMIVEGGPGTGKSVLAINLLARLLAKDFNTCYVSKNSAPREVYARMLKRERKKTEIDLLFQGSGSFTSMEAHSFDVILVDEAHRLNEKSGLFSHLGENQIKEVIHASYFSVFFLDEDQRVTTKDIGDMETIVKYANEANAKIECVSLQSQFRCDGSDGYLSWLDQVLDIKETAQYDLDGYPFIVVDSPQQLQSIIQEKNNSQNRARMVAGYCWDWIKDGKNNPNIHDITIGEYKASWNLGTPTPWAIDEASIDQVGCIHTCQGLEFDYIGVIIGPDLRYEEGMVITDISKRAKTDQSTKGLKKMAKENPEEAKQLAQRIIKNTYRTLLTRGMKGCYVYCVDEGLATYLKACTNK